MSKFSFKIPSEKTGPISTIEDGVQAASFVQVASIGLQRAFNPGDVLEKQMAVAFELATTEHYTKLTTEQK